jgi:hypothetical protein
MDQWIDAAEDQLHKLRADQQAVVDRLAQSVARFAVGYEYEARSGTRRFRITKVKGKYFSAHVREPIIWVCYRGVRLYKNGNAGREETLYPLEGKK